MTSYRPTVGMMSILLLLLLFDTLLCENCDRPIESDVTFGVGDAIAARQGGEGPTPSYTLQNWTINCAVVGSVLNKYKMVSITAQYLLMGKGEPDTQRFRMACVGGGAGWDYSSGSNFVVSDESMATMLINAETLKNCSSCDGGDSVNECVACHSSCIGLGYCGGSQSDDCCNYYDESNCVINCPANHVINETNFCVCDDFYQETACTVCTLEDSNCQNGGTAIMDTCSCNCDGIGYDGRFCDNDIDECSVANPCISNQTQTCNNMAGSYTCVCIDGFNGRTCGNNIDDCADMPCNNGATCVDGIDSYSCTCAPGYTDDTCNTNINECDPNPCQNGGTCQDEVNQYTCTCVEQYQGINCEEDFNECLSRSSPCLNEGVCQNTMGGYSCDCVGRWTGSVCDLCVIDSCARTNCSGKFYECLTCEDALLPVFPDKSKCVSCTIGNCTSCSDDNVCVDCAHDLVTNGTICQPRKVSRYVGTLSLGVIFAIIIALGVLVAVVIVSIVVVTIITLKIRAAKPIQYGAKNPIINKGPIVLEKISEI